MVIYKAEFPNGKVYIGKSKIFELRKYHHIWNSKRLNKNHIIMYKAINKYGPENIKWSIIYECSSIDEMNKKEIEFINLYKSTKYEFGYNMVCGDKEDYELRQNFDKDYRIDIIKRKLKSNGHDPNNYIEIDDNLSSLIIKDYQENLIGIRKLSKKYSISRQRLTRLFKYNKIEIDKDISSKINSYIPSNELIERVINNFKKSKTIKEISKDENLTILIVSRILHDSGIRKSKRFKNGKRYDGKQPKKQKSNN